MNRRRIHDDDDDDEAMRRQSARLRQQQRRQEMNNIQIEQRRIIDAQRHRLQMQAMDVDQRDHRRSTDAHRHHEYRQTMDVDQQERRRSTDAQRHREQMEAMDVDQRDRRRSTDAQRHREQMEAMDVNERDRRRSTDAQHHREQMEAMDVDERDRRRSTDAQHHREQMEAMDVDQRDRRRSIDAHHHHEYRQTMDVDQQEHRRRTDAQQHQLHRSIPAPFFMAARCCNLDNFQECTVVPFSLGDYNVRCSYCEGIGFESENRGTHRLPHFGSLCCNKGKIELPTYPSLPPELRQLMIGVDSRSKYFQNHIRMFNSGMAMASLEVKDETEQGGPAAFKVCGQLHRRIGPLIPLNDEMPTCLQVYFYDPTEQAEIRANRLEHSAELNHEMDTALFFQLQQILTQCGNTYLQSFLTCKEFTDSLDTPPEEIRFELHATERPDNGDHPGRYNLPTAPEISILMPNSFHEDERRVICSVRGITNGSHNLHFFQDYHRAYDPLQYPLLFPSGRDGWNLEVRSLSNDNKRVTLAQYNRYHLMERPQEANLMHLARKLFQQFIVDQYCKIEVQRFRFIRNQQERLRSNLYRGVRDALRQNNVEDSGIVTVLPSSFTGGDRYMHKNYQNAMAIIREKGKPTFFITMTCNINWPEIQCELKGGQSAYDRPDLLCRVFRQKVKELLKDLDGGIFGECLARTYTTEFQKRGAPHVHILVWIKDFTTAGHVIDDVISAEIPPPELPVLRELVVQTMIHGPCGSMKPSASCMKHGRCEKRFPRDFCDATRVGDDAYPTYRRRSPEHGGQTAIKMYRGVPNVYDNRYVVPYSPYLLFKYQCHINIEHCASIQSMKYLFKYQFKGNDMVTVEINEELDEVKSFETKRYVSSCEAIWRMHEYPLCELKPSVLQLPVHLEDEQHVTYHADPQHAEEAVAANEITMLTAFFRENLRSQMARNILYEDFPKHYSYSKSNKEWRPRKEKNHDRNFVPDDPDTPVQLGRMVTIHPSQGEKFYLRLLLKHKIGAMSFESLRTVDDIEYETYKGACIALELLQDDQQWRDCLTEACAVASASSIRQLFATILMHCEPTDPRALFDLFEGDMKEDIVYQLRDVPNLTPDEKTAKATNDLLIAINDMLSDANKSNREFSLPEPNYEEQRNAALRDSELDPNASMFYETHINLLNNAQQAIFDLLASLIDQGAGGLFHIDAPGGTGKTFLCNVLLAYVRKDNNIAVATAMSGIAANLLTKGTTTHKRFAFPITCYEDCSCNIPLHSVRAEILREAKIIFIDECSMMHYQLLNCLDHFLRELMHTQVVMGGKLIVLMGDFRQILPIVPNGHRADTVEATLRNSIIWRFFETLHLDENMRVQHMLGDNPSRERQQELTEHAKWLLEIGEGRAATDIQNIIPIPQQMICDSANSLRDQVYNDFEQHYNDPDYLLKRAIMAATNESIRTANREMLQNVPGELFIARSTDVCVEDSDQTAYDEDFLHGINPPGLPPHCLPLKVNSVIMLIRNLNISKGHCNGTRYIIQSITDKLIKAKTLLPSPNSEILIPRIPLLSQPHDFPAIFKRTQFPIVSAYYLTFNRSQGQSLERNGLELPQSVFAHGQLYVGLSRNGDPNCIFIHANQDEFVNLHDQLQQDRIYTRNVVYPEVFS